MADLKLNALVFSSRFPGGGKARRERGEKRIEERKDKKGPADWLGAGRGAPERLNCIAVMGYSLPGVRRERPGPSHGIRDKDDP